MGFNIMLAQLHDEFRRDIAPLKGLRPVFDIQQQWRNATVKHVNDVMDYCGKQIPVTRIEYIEPPADLEPYPDWDEVDEYLHIENEWMAEEILKRIGWKDFKNFCKLHKLDDIVKLHGPCEGPDGQCSFFCPLYWHCNWFQCNQRVK